MLHKLLLFPKDALSPSESKIIKLDWIYELLRPQTEAGPMYIVHLIHPQTGEQRAYRVEKNEYLKVRHAWKEYLGA